MAQQLSWSNTNRRARTRAACKSEEALHDTSQQDAAPGTRAYPLSPAPTQRRHGSFSCAFAQRRPAAAHVHHEHTHEHQRRFPARALCVGLMHGMAGSAALILLTLDTVASPVTGLTKREFDFCAPISQRACSGSVVGVGRPVTVIAHHKLDRLGDPEQLTQRFWPRGNGGQSGLGLAIVDAIAARFGSIESALSSRSRRAAIASHRKRSACNDDDLACARPCDRQSS